MSAPPLLETRGLRAGYGDFPVLFGVDFAIDAGETVAIIGANGAGKTTFLRCLAGVVPAARTQVVLDGDLNPFMETALAQQIKGGQRVQANGERQSAQ